MRLLVEFRPAGALALLFPLEEWVAVEEKEVKAEEKQNNSLIPISALEQVSTDQQLFYHSSTRHAFTCASGGKFRCLGLDCLTLVSHPLGIGLAGTMCITRDAIPIKQSSFYCLLVHWCGVRRGGVAPRAFRGLTRTITHNSPLAFSCEMMTFSPSLLLRSYAGSGEWL